MKNKAVMKLLAAVSATAVVVSGTTILGRADEEPVAEAVEATAEAGAEVTEIPAPVIPEATEGSEADATAETERMSIPFAPKTVRTALRITSFPVPRRQPMPTLSALGTSSSVS